MLGLVRSELLGQFLNTLTADYKYSRRIDCRLQVFSSE